MNIYLIISILLLIALTGAIRTIRMYISRNSILREILTNKDIAMTEIVGKFHTLSTMHRYTKSELSKLTSEFAILKQSHLEYREGFKATVAINSELIIKVTELQDRLSTSNEAFKDSERDYLTLKDFFNTEKSKLEFERDQLAYKALDLFSSNKELSDYYEAGCATNRSIMYDVRRFKEERDLLADKALQLWYDNWVYHNQLNKALNRNNASIKLDAYDYFVKHKLQ